MLWCSFLPFDPDVDLPGGGVEGVEPALHEQGPLDSEGGNEEIEAHSAKAVALQERHEEAESHKDHHVDVLKAWETKRTEGLMQVFIKVQLFTRCSVVVSVLICICCGGQSKGLS